jgi:hypothetical protein
MNDILIILIIVFFLFLFSLNDDTILNISKKAQFRISFIFIMLYFFYNNMTDGAVLIFFLTGIILMSKPDFKEKIILNIDNFYKNTKMKYQ